MGPEKTLVNPSIGSHACGLGIPSAAQSDVTPVLLIPQSLPRGQLMCRVEHINWVLGSGEHPLVCSGFPSRPRGPDPFPHLGFLLTSPALLRHGVEEPHLGGKQNILGS